MITSFTRDSLPFSPPHSGDCIIIYVVLSHENDGCKILNSEKAEDKDVPMSSDPLSYSVRLWL